MEKFLSIKAAPARTTVEAKPEDLEKVAEELASSLEDEQVTAFLEYRKRNNGIPPEFDGKLLAKARDMIGRDLLQTEKHKLRAKFVEAIKDRRSK